MGRGTRFWAAAVLLAACGGGGGAGTDPAGDPSRDLAADTADPDAPGDLPRDLPSDPGPLGEALADGGPDAASDPGPDAPDAAGDPRGTCWACHRDPARLLADLAADPLPPPPEGTHLGEC